MIHFLLGLDRPRNTSCIWNSMDPEWVFSSTRKQISMCFSYLCLICQNKISWLDYINLSLRHNTLFIMGGSCRGPPSTCTNITSGPLNSELPTFLIIVFLCRPALFVLFYTTSYVWHFVNFVIHLFIFGWIHNRQWEGFILESEVEDNLDVLYTFGSFPNPHVRILCLKRVRNLIWKLKMQNPEIY